MKLQVNMTLGHAKSYFTFIETFSSFKHQMLIGRKSNEDVNQQQVKKKLHINWNHYPVHCVQCGCHFILKISNEVYFTVGDKEEKVEGKCISH